MDFSTASTRSRDNGERLVTAYDAACWDLSFRYGNQTVRSEPKPLSEVINKEGKAIGKLLSVRAGGRANGQYSPPIYTIALSDGMTLG